VSLCFRRIFNVLQKLGARSRSRFSNKHSSTSLPFFLYLNMCSDYFRSTMIKSISTYTNCFRWWYTWKERIWVTFIEYIICFSSSSWHLLHSFPAHCTLTKHLMVVWCCFFIIFCEHTPDQVAMNSLDHSFIIILVKMVVARIVHCDDITQNKESA
jgi:hypothetical protein